MSKNKLTPLALVERYHEKYLEFEEAFNNDPFDPKEIEAKIKQIVEEGGDLDDDKIVEEMSPMMIEKQERKRDVNNAALKFMLHANFYLSTNEEDLPENIKKDLDNLPEVLISSLKEINSIQNGKFIRNEKKVISPEEKKYILEGIQYIKTLL